MKLIDKELKSLCIVVEENDETLFWMECFEELDWGYTRNLKIYYTEAFEILKVMASTKKKLGGQK